MKKFNPTRYAEINNMKKKKQPEVKEVPKRPEPDPNKTSDAFLKVWKLRHGK